MTDLNNPETIEIHGLRTITKLCHFGADNNMEGCTFTEIVERLFAELEKAKAQAVPEWISVEDRMPESLRNVLVLIDANPVKNQNQMVAHFIPKFTEEYHGDNDWYDYDEDRGCGYVKEGWYANTAYIGDEYSSYFIEEKVTHWKPLKEASESGAEG
ncbi:hypothetical protein J921_3817 [Acinetobacter baumannii 25493_8]|uniref:DUF551 domain-containing protein n=4 Tax=Acinetobacter baumannii TaxID=470 RepID=UPI0002BA9592|nr:DUF551 domain-containing protein [Acinetobacter baumannii]EHU2133754.1 DUF551 domain-containing protein [Acinetobacter baumannii]EIG0125830.1 DUF551 domain-containing protein [Acinetobacter baumannii]EXA76513.1 hypothetical protein J523_3309 [Acinetobacter baumannii 1202252]EXC52255.1 hypothetical protein J470_3326 [Acinetobacter baumannii 1032241]EXC60870.1 hypothetical protein J489_3642 [Acinetobacter baumannii 1040094]